jgi:hypothetical protein
MNIALKPTVFSLAIAALLVASQSTTQAQSATATISDVAAGGGVFDYTIILDNTGGTSLNSFWYGWTQSGNNLPSDPSNAGNSLGWANTLDGNSIMWQNSTGSALAAGHTASFTFQSTSTISQITAGESGASVAYVGTIDFSQGVGGDSTGVFSPTIAPVPEPSTLGLGAVGLSLIGASYRRFGNLKK